MDKFTRNYSIILAAVAVIALIWVFYDSPGVSRLNALLSENADLVAYPYRFRVLNLEDGVATVSTPRSAEFPAYRALAILIVAGSDDVNRVTWELDENWLRSEGIDPGQL